MQKTISINDYHKNTLFKRLRFHIALLLSNDIGILFSKSY